MLINHSKIIEVLGGVNAVAGRLKIKPPSVSGWTPPNGETKIPDSRLMELGADIEATGLYTRQQLLPHDFWRIWPDLAHLAPAPAPAEGATA